MFQALSSRRHVVETVASSCSPALISPCARGLPAILFPCRPLHLYALPLSPDLDAHRACWPWTPAVPLGRGPPRACGEGRWARK